MTIGIHDLGRAELVDGFVQRIDAELGLQRVRDTPGQNLARVPVHNGHEIQKAPPHGQWRRSAFALLLPEPYAHLSAHMALHSILAHGHGNIMISRCDGIASFAPEDVWISLRVPPPELRLGTGYHPAQLLADAASTFTSSIDKPGLCLACLRRSIPAQHQRLDA